MSIFKKAKEISEKITETTANLGSDEMLADTILKAVEKQEKVNQILQQKGSQYRIADLDIGMSLPPSVTFGIRRVGGDVIEEIEGENTQPQAPQE